MKNILKILSIFFLLTFMFACDEEEGGSIPVDPIDPDHRTEIPEGCEIYEDPIGAFEDEKYFVEGNLNNEPFEAVGGYFALTRNTDLGNGQHPFRLYFNSVDKCNRADHLFRIKLLSELKVKTYDLAAETNSECVNSDDRVYAFNNLGVWGELVFNQVYDSLLTQSQNTLIINKISSEENFVEGEINLHVTKKHCTYDCFLDSIDCSGPWYEDWEPQIVSLTNVEFKLPLLLE